MRSLAAPPHFVLSARARGLVTLNEADGPAVVHLAVLEEDLIRVVVLPRGGFDLARTWAIAPGETDVADNGRDRLDLSGFACPDFQLVEDGRNLTLETAQLRLSVALKGFFCRWEMRDRSGAWCEIARDRPTQAYDFDYWARGPRHYLRRTPGERYVGLGERAGPMDRAGGLYRLNNVDAMGYDAASSDPLYKHIPFYITLGADDPARAFGLFYDTLADCTFDFGRERSNYHGLYRSFAAEAGDLDYYVIAGPSVLDVTRRFTWLTGRPIFTPRWGLGYSGSTMSYTDAPDAQAQMARFLEGLAAHDLPCSSFHLSSGYTSIGPRRYVFHWNREKFPDPKGFTASYEAAGVKLCANIKPCLLDDHPLFGEARDQGLFIADAAGEPVMTQFWDGLGAYLDFTNPATRTWWKAQVTTQLLEVGIAATWNDNNEFEVVSPQAQAAMNGQPRAAIETKPLQTLLMMRASAQAQRAHSPGERPFLVSRAGVAGMQRYVQTWSGDNYTAWGTIRFNQKMGLGLALSGVSNSGHDVGGFAGPAPDAELLARWVAAGIFQPRFSIHSWNDDGSVNEPWMHPEATPAVRALIRLRGLLEPLLYDLLFRHHRDFEVITRPLFAQFPDDPACLADGDEMMLGPDLLVAPVMDPGVTERIVRAPAGCDWRDFWSGARTPGGAEVTLPAPWDQPPLLVRDGAALPISTDPRNPRRRRLESFGWLVFPREQGESLGEAFDDDGVTEAWRDGDFSLRRLRLTATSEDLEIAPKDPAERIEVWLPAKEQRPARALGWRITADQTQSGRRRLILERIAPV
jgi:alpha-glucosidase